MDKETKLITITAVCLTLSVIAIKISVDIYEEYRARQAIEEISQAMERATREEEAKSQQLVAQVQMEAMQLKAEADARQAEADAKQAEAEARQAQHEEMQRQLEEQRHQAELAKFNREIVQHQSADQKRAEFEKQFNPRTECNDPNLEWSKSVQCKNEKIAAREKFYKTH